MKRENLTAIRLHESLTNHQQQGVGPTVTGLQGLDLGNYSAERARNVDVQGATFESTRPV